MYYFVKMVFYNLNFCNNRIKELRMTEITCITF